MWCFPVKTSASVLRQLLVERVFSVSVFYVWTKTNFQFRLHFLETPLILLIPITYPFLADVCERSVQTPSPGMNVRLFLFERTHHGGNEKWYILYMIPENKIEVLKQLHIFGFKQWLALLYLFWNQQNPPNYSLKNDMVERRLLDFWSCLARNLKNKRYKAFIGG